MHVIDARNVNDAFPIGLNLLWREGLWQNSRAGRVKVCPFPVTTIYRQPMERVLFHPIRDANPFFHLFESLWMLSGSNDATPLDTYVSDFSKRFAEEDGRQHGAYGFRWRQHFEPEGGGGYPRLPDQLDTLVEMLTKNPDDRRAVLTMWDPVADLAVDKRDIPCNTHVYLRVRSAPIKPVLDITVCCRSNDAVWGAYGANAVHFSVLQEYLAARLGVKVGTYYQVSNNFHIYENVFEKFTYPLVESMGCEYSLGAVVPTQLIGGYFGVGTRGILFEAHALWKDKQRNTALSIVEHELPHNNDWRLAALQWMNRRMEKSRQ